MTTADRWCLFIGWLLLMAALVANCVVYSMANDVASAAVEAAVLTKRLAVVAPTMSQYEVPPMFVADGKTPDGKTVWAPVLNRMNRRWDRPRPVERGGRGAAQSFAQAMPWH